MSGIFSSPAGLARQLSDRRRSGLIWMGVFYLATLLAVLSLITLAVNIVDGAFGYIAVVYTTDPAELAKDGVPLKDLTKEALIVTLNEQTQVFETDSDKGISPKRLEAIIDERSLEERSRDELEEIIRSEVLRPEVLKTWTLIASLTAGSEIKTWLANETQTRQDNEEPGGAIRLEFRSWINLDFLLGTQSPDAETTGIRTALLGSALIILLTLLFAFPVGVAAAVYLEEFAKRTGRFARIIQVNIYNLAGVPSIIYGLLGLAVFVRSLGDITQGRTIISAALTLAVLILPIIIINSQEAIRSVSQSLRSSSLALGATKWQTVWHHVLPGSLDRILTGTILAVSRGIGETAPLIVVGAATFLQKDPTSLFSAFTVLPIQVYQLTTRPQEEFRNAAAAAIIVLVVLLLVLNSTAIVLRNTISKKRRAT